MLEGMYTAAAGMAAQQDRLDAVSNDLANVNTTGYKEVRIGFRDLLYHAGGRDVSGNIQFGVGSAATEMGRNSAEGALKTTSQPLDLAVEGSGYIAVKDANGKPAMTRDGALRIDDKSQLTTENGLLLDPPIHLPAGTQPSDVGIGADGTVTVASKTVGKLRLVDVRAESALATGPDNVYYATKASGAATGASPATKLKTGALEQSNVDVGTAMVDMIQSQRSYELASKAINVQDEMMQTANQVKK